MICSSSSALHPVDGRTVGQRLSHSGKSTPEATQNIRPSAPRSSGTHGGRFVGFDTAPAFGHDLHRARACRWWGYRP